MNGYGSALAVVIDIDGTITDGEKRCRQAAESIQLEGDLRHGNVRPITRLVGFSDCCPMCENGGVLGTPPEGIRPCNS